MISFHSCIYRTRWLQVATARSSKTFSEIAAKNENVIFPPQPIYEIKWNEDQGYPCELFAQTSCGHQMMQSDSLRAQLWYWIPSSNDFHISIHNFISPPSCHPNGFVSIDFDFGGIYNTILFSSSILSLPRSVSNCRKQLSVDRILRDPCFISEMRAYCSKQRNGAIEFLFCAASLCVSHPL